MSYIRGRVDRVIHFRGTFNVLVFDIFEYSGIVASKSCTAAGHLFGIDKMLRGIVLELEGDWVKHAKYGRQFKIRSWRPWSRHSLDVEAFFEIAVNVFSNTGLMERFVDFYGNDSYDVLMDERAEGFSEEESIKGLIRTATDRWKTIRAIANLADFLQEYELSPALIESIFDRFGPSAVDILADNSYRLLEVEGVSFQSADKIAARRGMKPGDPNRIGAAVLWTLRDRMRQHGHLYLRRGDIAPMLTDLVQRTGIEPFGVADPAQAVSDAINELEKHQAVRVEPDVGVYLADMHLFERGGAGMLSSFLTPSELSLDLEGFLTAYQTTNDIVLSDLQCEAVAKLISNRVLVVTGAPGTGKTTLIKAFVQLFRTLGVSFSLMAPTGIAAKRLAYVTGATASTIHRALKYDGAHWGCNAGQKLEVGAVIVDEVSMVDQELLFRVLDALEPTTMLVFVGDDAQLPSVGPGNVLRELIASGGIPMLRLEHVFRQAESSDIVLAAHKIRKGESPLDLPPKEGTEFQFVRCSDEDLICKRIVQLAVRLKSRDANFQVLAPKYEGTVGVDNLNECLKEALNPDQGQPQCNLPNKLNVRVGDRLMVIKNDYVLNVYNGDIGKLMEIRRDALVVKVHGIGSDPDMIVAIPRDKAPQMLKLAYCVTVHKSQGEEFETVILPLVRSHGRMLQRNLFYTAITRARAKVWLLGEIDAVLKAVANARVQQRNTVLSSLIRASDRRRCEPLQESRQGTVQE